MGKKFLATLVACSVLLLIIGCTPRDVSIAKRISESTVYVHVMASRGQRISGAICGGVVVSPHEILLANHCVDVPKGVTLDKIWVRDYWGRVQEATIEAKDRTTDLALLKIRKKEVPARIASRPPPVGSTIWIVVMPWVNGW